MDTSFSECATPPSRGLLPTLWGLSQSTGVVGQTGNLNTKSHQVSVTAKPLNKAIISWFVDKLLAQPADKADPRLNLVNAKLAGLPPVTSINAQIDPLRQDGAVVEAALKKAGVRVTRNVYSGVTHEFFGMAAAVKKAADAQAQGGFQTLNPFFGSTARVLAVCFHSFSEGTAARVSSQNPRNLWLQKR